MVQRTGTALRVGEAELHLWPDRDREQPRLGGGCQTCDVRSCAICAAFAADELSLLEREASPIHIDANATLVDEGDEVARIYIVVRGMLRIVRYLPDGRRHVVDFLAPGDFTGNSIGRTYEHSLEAVVDSELCSIGRARVEELGQVLPKLQDRLLGFACLDLYRARELQLSLGRRSPAEKVAAFLLDLSERAERLGDGGTVVSLPMTRHDIADHLGLTIETVSRTFTRLRQKGAITLRASHLVELRDRAALKDLANRYA